MATTGNPDLTSVRWAKSRHSANGGNCVEIARNLPGIVAVRDSKHPNGPVLILTPAQWRTFTSHIKGGASGLA